MTLEYGEMELDKRTYKSGRGAVFERRLSSFLDAYSACAAAASFRDFGIRILRRGTKGQNLCN
jgi:hypothetical protein